MNKKFKFEFYGWLVIISIVINLMLSPIPVIGTIPFLALIIGAYIYAKWKQKKIDGYFVANVILTGVALFLLIVVLGFIGLGALGWFTWKPL